MAKRLALLQALFNIVTICACELYLDNSVGAGEGVGVLPKVRACSTPSDKYKSRRQTSAPQTAELFKKWKIASESTDLACLELIETRDER
jgi:hypothetical protein